MKLRHDSQTEHFGTTGNPRAFTLIELLVTLSLISILIAILLPALRSVRGQSRALKCQINMRSVAFDFQAFLSPEIPMNRGNDEGDPTLGRDHYWLETFQETQYRIDEFWDRAGSNFRGSVNDLGVMACPEVAGDIQLRSGKTCRGGSVSPPRNVSYSMNLRLDHSEVKIGNMWGTQHARLSDNLFNKQLIPLIWDIDGIIPEKRLITPHYSAPPGVAGTPYSSGNEWFPSESRHGKLQVAFTSGEVLTSSDPLNEATWGWFDNP